MKLYVANVTKMAHELHFRVKNVAGMKSQRIAPGQQTYLFGDMNQEQLDALVAWLSKYGGTSVEDFERVRSRTAVAYLYSVDRPVSGMKIVKAMNHNQGVLVHQGEETRKLAAISAHNKIENPFNDMERSLQKVTEVEVVEERRKDASPEVDDHMRVENPALASAPASRRGRRIRS